MDKYFEKRKQEMKRAEEPRAPVMEQADTSELNGKKVLPNGRQVSCADTEVSSDEASYAEPKDDISERAPVDTPKSEQDLRPEC